MKISSKRFCWKKTREAFCLNLVLSAFCGTIGQVFPAVFSLTGQEGQNAGQIQAMREAKSQLRLGVNSWDSSLLENARNMFIQMLIQAKQETAVLSYYVALADTRLSSFSFSRQDMSAAERWIGEGEQYLEKAMAADPAFGEAFALYGYLLGMELALDPDKAMTLGMKSFGAFDQALQKTPSNPRIHLLQGIYLLYVPEAFGGGPDRSLESLVKAAGFFEAEKLEDPMKPDWGRDEAYTYLGIAYKRKGDAGKAREMLEKALSVNPDSGQAKSELAALNRKSPAS